jgi:hypothetical protein
MRVPLARQVQIRGGEYLIDTILCIFGGGQAWQEHEAGVAGTSGRQYLTHVLNLIMR